MFTLLMSAEQTLNREKTTKKTRRKRDKVNPIPNKEEKNDKKQAKEDYDQQSLLLQQIKSVLLPEPIIYNPSDNNSSNNQQRNLSLAADDDNNIRDQQRQISTSDAKKIADYYLTFHKNMINIHNSIYSEMLQGISNSYNNGLLTANERFTEYSLEIENMYSNLIGNRDKSLKLIDDIITKNLDTFIKSIELNQRFCQDIVHSYLRSIKKVDL